MINKLCMKIKNKNHHWIHVACAIRTTENIKFSKAQSINYA